MTDFLRSARTGIRAAVLMSVAVVFICLFVGVENDYSQAIADLDSIMNCEQGLYIGKSRAALKAKSNDGEIVEAFFVAAKTCSIAVEPHFPGSYQMWARTNSNYSGTPFNSWPGQYGEIGRFLTEVRGKNKPISYFESDIGYVSRVLSALMSELHPYNPSLKAYRLASAKNGTTEMQIDFDTQMRSMPDSVFVPGGIIVKQILSSKINDGNRFKYAFDVEGRAVVVFPSFSSFFVDSLNLFTMDVSGSLRFPALEKMLPEIGDMEGQEALRHLRKMEESKKLKGSVLSLPFNYLEQSWIPLAIIFSFLFYSFLHLQAALLRPNGEVISSDFGWLLLLGGWFGTGARFIFLLVPVFACLISLFIWPGHKGTNIVFLLLVLVLAVLIYRALILIRRRYGVLGS